MKDKLKIVFDMVLNIAATALPTALLQLLVLPGVAGKLGDADYGLMVTLVSLTSVVSLALGNVLNNMRLLRQTEYDELGEYGDFNILLFAAAAVNVVSVFVASFLYSDGSFGDAVFTLLTSLVMLLQGYISVWFRIELNYKRVMINSLFMVCGYALGYVLFLLVGVWQLIYFCGYLTSCIHIFRIKNMLAVPLARSARFRTTAGESVELTVSSIIGNAVNYVDKLLLYPLMGGAAVSIYYSATIIGKICSMVVSPISSVMLSYLSKMKEFRRNAFFLTLLCTAAAALVGYFLCLLISSPLLKYLYPEWAEESILLIPVTTASAMVSLVCSVLSPIVLKFCKMNRQIIINAATLTVYAVLGIWLLKLYGLNGFAVGMLLTNIAKMVMLIFVFLLANKKGCEQEC